MSRHPRGLAVIRLAAGLLLVATVGSGVAFAASSKLADALDRKLRDGEARLVEWRRHLHAHPELGNREVETAAFVAERLRAMGLEPRTGIAKTGVVAVIEPRHLGSVEREGARVDSIVSAARDGRDGRDGRTGAGPP